MNKLLIAFSLSVLILFSFSCRNKNVAKKRDLKLVSNIIKNDIDFKYFSSRAKLKVESEQFNVGLPIPVQLRIEKGKQIWASVMMPGISFEMMRAKITLDSVFIINRPQKSYTALSLKDFSQQMGANLDYRTLEALVMGDVPIKDLEKVKITTNKQYILINQMINDVQVENKVSKTMQRLESLKVWNDVNGSIKSKYSDFELLDDQMFAKQIDIRLEPKDKEPMVVEVKHSRMKKSVEPLNFPFKIPDSYEKK